jgi:nucleotide-binding universal stress UspA family protein
VFKTLIVPLDGSEFASRAVPVAVAIASASHADLRLVAVGHGATELRRVDDLLRATASRITTTAVDVGMISDEDPTSALLRIAADPELVLCFASHDHTGVATSLLHSVGSALMVRAWQPFVLVGTATDVDPSARDIVVAIDGVSDPRGLLGAASAWTRQLDAPLRIVTVYEPVLDGSRRDHGPSGDPDAYLHVMMRDVIESGIASVSCVSIADPVSVAAGLEDHLASRPGQLLVVGSHHDDRIRLGIGTVRRLVRTLKVPMLVVKPSRQ